MSSFKLGKKPFTPDHRDLMLSSYLGTLPTIPDSFGHDNLATFQMFGNDIAGDCVEAGAYNLSELWNAEAKKEFIATTQDAIGTYSNVTGYNANDPSTDNGTNMRQFLKYWKKHGIPDSSGKRHKIAAYISIDTKNLEHIKAAMYLFGGVYAGIKFPQSAMEQFNNGQPWTVIDSSIEGGHCVPLVHCENVLTCVTWGKEQPGTLDFWNKYLDEAWCVLSEEMLTDGCNLEGFNVQDLIKDLKLL